eukprot:TRINITY_DN9765_c0_g1_i1.p1 TRINITY_DN9765_c0_g1~~TRINITY_DN9765_c0_g1_i1.p1  ORF type:complete len:892 (-),score=227.05 TRINITY_DN9765_c0_g1_i1:14-2665(-)
MTSTTTNVDPIPGLISDLVSLRQEAVDMVKYSFQAPLSSFNFLNPVDSGLSLTDCSNVMLFKGEKNLKSFYFGYNDIVEQINAAYEKNSKQNVFIVKGGPYCGKTTTIKYILPFVIYQNFRRELPLSLYFSLDSNPYFDYELFTFGDNEAKLLRCLLKFAHQFLACCSNEISMKDNEMIDFLNHQITFTSLFSKDKHLSDSSDLSLLNIFSNVLTDLINLCKHIRQHYPSTNIIVSIDDFEKVWVGLDNQSKEQLASFFGQLFARTKNDGFIWIITGLEIGILPTLNFNHTQFLSLQNMYDSLFGCVPTYITTPQCVSSNYLYDYLKVFTYYCLDGNVLPYTVESSTFEDICGQIYEEIIQPCLNNSDNHMWFPSYLNKMFRLALNYPSDECYRILFNFISNRYVDQLQGLLSFSTDEHISKNFNFESIDPLRVAPILHEVLELKTTFNSHIYIDSLIPRCVLNELSFKKGIWKKNFIVRRDYYLFSLKQRLSMVIKAISTLCCDLIALEDSLVIYVDNCNLQIDNQAYQRVIQNKLVDFELTKVLRNYLYKDQRDTMLCDIFELLHQGFKMGKTQDINRFLKCWCDEAFLGSFETLFVFLNIAETFIMKQPQISSELVLKIKCIPPVKSIASKPVSPKRTLSRSDYVRQSSSSPLLTGDFNKNDSFSPNMLFSSTKLTNGRKLDMDRTTTNRSLLKTSRKDFLNSSNSVGTINSPKKIEKKRIEPKKIEPPSVLAVKEYFAQLTSKLIGCYMNPFDFSTTSNISGANSPTEYYLLFNGRFTKRYFLEQNKTHRIGEHKLIIEEIDPSLTDPIWQYHLNCQKKKEETKNFLTKGLDSPRTVKSPRISIGSPRNLLMSPRKLSTIGFSTNTNTFDSVDLTAELR